jgi:hypothetical protein
MDQNPGLVSVPPPHPNQLVHQAAAQLGIPDHLLELLIEEVVPSSPVCIRSGPREEELHEFPEVALDHFLPGAVVVGADGSFLGTRHVQDLLVGILFHLVRFLPQGLSRNLARA